MTPHVISYARISRDEAGEQAAVRRQADACRSSAAARGWDLVEELQDVDTSAFRNHDRPAFESLQQRVDGGGIDGVLVWKLDRLVRRPAEFEKFWIRCVRRNVFLASVTEPIDTSTELGVTLVRILVAFANMESATTSLRLQAKERERALAGTPPSRGKVYGWTADWSEVVPAEAALIREACTRVISGEGLIAIARAWTERGEVGPRGRHRQGSSSCRRSVRCYSGRTGTTPPGCYSSGGRVIASTLPTSGK